MSVGFGGIPSWLPDDAGRKWSPFRGFLVLLIREVENSQKLKLKFIRV